MWTKVEKYYSEETEKCYICNQETNNSCSFCGMPYCKECFEKLNNKCKHCNSDGYD
jgi:hypothetical protein